MCQATGQRLGHDFLRNQATKSTQHAYETIARTYMHTSASTKAIVPKLEQHAVDMLD